MILQEPDTNGAFVNSDSREWLIVTRKPIGMAIRDAVLAVTKIGIKDFTSERRFRSVVKARHIFFYLARKHTALSFPQIGSAAGNRDHSTAMHGYNKVLYSPEAFEPELSLCEKRVELILLAREKLG